MSEPDGPDGSSVQTPLSAVPTGDTGQSETLVDLLNRKIVGQSAALQYIAPYVQMYQAGLAPPDRPAGIFLLLGPTGTGKTRTVEALAEVLHGRPRLSSKLIAENSNPIAGRAKLIGAPPGYLGHRETKPLLTQERLSAVASSGVICRLSSSMKWRKRRRR